MFEQQIKSWLQAGIIDDFRGQYSEQNTLGTPQGGVISPLLCNVALHGMESELLSHFPRDGVKIIRYADDFMITGARLVDIIRAKWIVTDFLKKVNLQLSEEKTRIGHSQNSINLGQGTIPPGFDFLGYHFRNYKRSIHRGVKTTRGKKMLFQQASMPSRKAMDNQKNALKKILKDYRVAPLKALIAKLSARIKG